MADNIKDTVIIGSGPAGFTAAIYAARANLKPVMFTGLQPGGQLTTTTDVENFPGYPDGIMGPEMMDEFQKQAERFGTEIHMDYITEVELSNEEGKLHKVKSGGGMEIEARTVIISTGATAKYLGLDDEQKYLGNGVSSCATCDGFFFKERPVVVVGGGDTAAEEATYLANICAKVYLLVRRDEMRASKVMQDRVFKTENIEVMFHHELKGISGEKAVETAHIINNQTDEKKELAVDGVFIAIGHKPNTDLFKGILDMDETGYLITKGKSTLTNLPGVFAAGDVQDNVYRQAVTAAGTGCMAALDAEKYIMTNFH